MTGSTHYPVNMITPANQTASEIARETIKRMALERIAPTPEHYQRIYNQIANIPQPETLDDALSKALKTLPRDTVEHSKWIKAWDKLVVDGDLSVLPALLESGMETKVAESRLWPDTIKDLLKSWDTKQTGLTPQRKKKALDRVLTNFGKDPQLPQKIQAMTKSWSKYASTSSGNTGSLVEETPVTATPADSANPTPTIAALSQSANEIPDNPASTSSENFYEAFKALQETLRQSINFGLLPRLDGYPDLKNEARDILALAEKARKLAEWQTLTKKLKALLMRVELIGADEEGIKNDLLNLLRLLVDNISELVVDDQWLQGQIAVVQTIISSPLEKTLIKDAEKSLKEVIFKQGTLKHSLTEAKQNFKQMITIFVGRLGSMSDSTGQYQGKVEGYADKLAKTDDITQINHIVESLMQDTRMMQTDIMRSREILVEQQNDAIATEEKIRKLEQELSDLSDKVRIDQLTGVLNRRGLDEAFVNEISRAQRGETKLSIVLLDIDNFKRLNDTHGHDAGDKALQHLATTVKQTVRPADIVARFGGEEFVILLPGTDIKEGVEVVARLQRELTKKFFMHNNERLLVTFSAGVSLYRLGEEQANALQRADKSMYLAKTTGKNRVMTELDLDKSHIQAG